MQHATWYHATCNIVPCNMQHGTTQHATRNRATCNMQHHHIIAGKYLKQAKCSSRQKVQAGKSSSRHILPCNMQHGTMQDGKRDGATYSIQHGKMQHAKKKNKQ